MDVESLAAIADPTRRRVFELLNIEGPLAVTDVAQRVPVSRPAVSQHLRVLVEAGLVTSERAGRRRLYQAVPAGLEPLRVWLDRQWDTALDALEQAARKDVTMGSTDVSLPPVVKRRTIPLPPEKAFDLFTERMGEWWPTQSHSVSGSADAQIRFGGQVGDRVVEVAPDGAEYSWADILVWDPPRRLVLSWHPSTRPVAASRLEIRFAAIEEGTEIVLVHGGWEEFPEPDALRHNYDAGWDPVLAALVSLAST